MSDYLPKNAKFSLGQIVYHSKFKYRGVIVHGQGNETYVAESNLTTDDNLDPVDHPFVDIFFYEYDNSGQYSLKQTFN